MKHVGNMWLSHGHYWYDRLTGLRRLAVMTDKLKRGRGGRRNLKRKRRAERRNQAVLDTFWRDTDWGGTFSDGEED